jgi:hypothetical protein
LQRPNVPVIRIDRAADLEIIAATVVAPLASGSPGNPAASAIVGVQQAELHIPESIALDPRLGRPLTCGDRIVPTGVAIGPVRLRSSNDLDAPYSAIGQIYRTRESVGVAIVAPVHIKGAHDRVVAARVIVSVYAAELDVAEAVLLIRPVPDRILAGTSGIVRGTAAIPRVQWRAHAI